MLPSVIIIEGTPNFTVIKPLKEAVRRAEDDTHDERQVEVHADHAQIGDKHTRNRIHRADGQVDLPHDHQVGEADCRKEVDTRLKQQRQDIIRAVERLCSNGQGNRKYQCQENNRQVPPVELAFGLHFCFLSVIYNLIFHYIYSSLSGITFHRPQPP